MDADRYFHIEPDPPTRIVRLVRTATPMPADAAAVAQVYAEMAKPLTAYLGWRALLDLRAVATGRNDDAFEQQSVRAQTAMAKLFSRTAVLVRSAVGKLQVRRMSQNQIAVFQDEAEALRFLAEPAK